MSASARPRRVGRGLVGLADRDDWLRPEKLDELVGALAGGVQLAYSDYRAVTGDGELLGPSFFPRPRNNSSDLGRMLLANYVTGAASMVTFEPVDDLCAFGGNSRRLGGVIVRQRGQRVSSRCRCCEASYAPTQHDRND